MCPTPARPVQSASHAQPAQGLGAFTPNLYAPPAKWHGRTSTTPPDTTHAMGAISACQHLDEQLSEAHLHQTVGSY